MFQSNRGVHYISHSSARTCKQGCMGFILMRQHAANVLFRYNARSCLWIWQLQCTSTSDTPKQPLCGCRLKRMWLNRALNIQQGSSYSSWSPATLRQLYTILNITLHISEHFSQHIKCVPSGHCSTITYLQYKIPVYVCVECVSYHVYLCVCLFKGCSIIGVQLCASSLNRHLGAFSMSTLLTKTSQSLLHFEPWEIYMPKLCVCVFEAWVGIERD